MDYSLRTLEAIFQKIPLTMLEVWGSFGFIVGLIVMVFAYGGFTFRTGHRWAIGREWQAWDEKSLQSILISFVLIFVTGYIGSFFVLVPGAQTFESLKDLSVFLCIVLFGYPALLAVPFAYGLTDLYEGVPPDFLLNWLPGYFINPACFWIANQFIGKDPDFRKKNVWGRYLLFVLIFMCIEPQLWGYICSEKFTSKISYTHITPALFFTTAITWIIAPFFMLGAYPLAKKFGLFWADIPSHTKQRLVGFKEWCWQSGESKSEEISDPKAGFPIRLFLLIPFVLVTLVAIGMTAYFSLKNVEDASHKLAQSLHLQTTENLKLKLDNYLALNGNQFKTEGLEVILNTLALSKNGKALILSKSDELIASSFSMRRGFILKGVIGGLSRYPKGINGIKAPVQFKFDIVTAKPISRETWMTLATPYGKDWVLVTSIPESYYMQGVNTANSQSAMVFAAALVIVLLMAGILSAMVINPIQKICNATIALAENDYSQRVPPSRLREINTLASAFNNMSEQLEKSLESLLIESEEKKVNQTRLQLALQAAKLGIWEWSLDTDELIWDEQMYRLYGLDSSKVKMSYDLWSKGISPDDHKRINDEVIAALKGDKEFESEFRIIHPNGTERILKSHSMSIRNEVGRATRMIGINYDITEQKKNEAEILHYRHHLEELVERRTIDLVAKTSQLRELTEKQTKAEVYEKFAQIFLSMRDNANSPLQVQNLVVAMLKKYTPERTDIINHLETSVASLTNMNKILTRLESRISMTSTKLMTEEEILAYLDKFETKS